MDVELPSSAHLLGDIMHSYTPDKTPDPQQWLALREEKRMQLAEKYRRTARIKVPNVRMHAVFHAIVEN
jgi:hypothetical protein